MLLYPYIPKSLAKALLIGTMTCLLLGFADSSTRAAISIPVTESILISTLDTAPDNLNIAIRQGITDYETGKFNHAIQQWEQALTQLSVQDYPLHQAFLYSNLSLAHQNLGQWEQAEIHLKQSLELLANHPQNNSDYQEILAKALNAQGRLQWSQGQSETAYKTWEKAAKSYRAAGSLQGELGSTMNQAKALQVLGLTSQAEHLLQEVAKHLEKQPDLALKQQGLLSLGEVLRHMGKFKQAQETLNNALKIKPPTVAATTLASIHLELANTQYALWTRAIALEQDEKEPEYLKQTSSLYQQAIALAPTDSPISLKAQLNHLNLLVKAGKTEDIKPLSSKLYQKLSSLQPTQANILAQINLADSLIHYRQTFLSEQSVAKIQSDKDAEPTWPQLVSLLNRARKQAQDTGDKRLEAYALGELGRIYEYNQRWEDAQKLTQEALSLADQVLALDLRYRWEWQMGRLFQAQEKQKAAVEAYQASVKTLEKIRRDLLVVNSDAQFSLRDNVEPIYRELIELLLSNQASNDNNILTQENLKNAIQQVNALQLAELQDFLRCSLDIVELEQQDIDPKAATIYPILLKNKIITILSLPDSKELQYSTIDIDGYHMDEVLEKLRIDIERDNSRDKEKELKKQVYDWLIRPIEENLKTKDLETLVFILDSKLRNIPPSVLFDGQQYLIEKYAIALSSPGLQLVQPERLKVQSLNALNFGLSVTQANFEPHKGFSDLPNIEPEIQSIEQYIPSQSFLNQEFEYENFVKKLEEFPFPILHLATHGQFSSDLENTFILVWDQQVPLHQLGQLLRQRELVSNQALELLVLSACETADGDRRATLGLAGLAVRSGARSTIASLWGVNDASAAQLMTAFYEILGTSDRSITKAEALRQAQIRLIKNGKSPYHWSPFILVGNWL